MVRRAVSSATIPKIAINFNKPVAIFSMLLQPLNRGSNIRELMIFRSLDLILLHDRHAISTLLPQRTVIGVAADHDEPALPKISPHTPHSSIVKDNDAAFRRIRVVSLGNKSLTNVLSMIFHKVQENVSASVLEQ